MMSLSKYYIHKASSILPNGKGMVKCVEVWTIIGVLFYLSMSATGFINWEESKTNLCTLTSFVYIRLLDLTCVFLFGVLYYKLGSIIKSQEHKVKQSS